MKIVTTFEEGQKINVQRVENDMVVGKRTIYFADYVSALMDEQPLDNLISNMISRPTEIEDYFNNLNSEADLQSFLTMSFKALNNRELCSNTQYLELIKQLLGKCSAGVYDDELKAVLLEAFLKGLRKLPSDGVFADLTTEMARRLLDPTQVSSVANNLLKEIVRMAKDTHEPALKEWFEIAIKQVSVEWLTKELEERASNSEEVVQSIVELPKNCIAYKKTNKSDTYAIEIPKSTLRVKFHNITYDNVGHPRMVAVVSIRKNKCVGMKIFAVQEEADLSFDVELYNYPYSNVHKGGVVCWSGLSDYDILSSKDIAMLPMTFLSGSNNTHLQSNVRELFEQAKDKEFDDSLLMPMKKTLKDIF
ncbi:hypothetical protein [Viridibacillus arvi]|uniref:hypothetical protein n=1 Tax=Viridibacillus arvi TaxID=263475 RepID=UPI0034CD88F6